MTISVIITSLNRHDCLTRTVKAWRDYGDRSAEIVIADDGSDDETKTIIASLQPSMAILSPMRRGLGANINRACDVAHGDFHFLLQDDFELTANILEDLRIGVAVLQNNECDIFRLGTPFDARRFFPKHYPANYDPLVNMSCTKKKDITIATAKNNAEAWIYTDNPHLRKKDFLTKFGGYDESIVKMADCETEFRDRCNKKHIKSAWRTIRETLPVFNHIGAVSNRTDRGF